MDQLPDPKPESQSSEGSSDDSPMDENDQHQGVDPEEMDSSPDTENNGTGVADAIAEDLWDIDSTSLRYDMSHKNRGMFVIINNTSYLEETKKKNVDAEKLATTFKKLGFDVRRYDKLTCREMHTLMEKVGQEDHTDNDCFGCAILSQGDENKVLATDGFIQIDLLVQSVKGDNCQSLVGKPKMFFIQMSRGAKVDSGSDRSDSGGNQNKKQKLPTEADILVVHSTPPGYVSWRTKKGDSWFIQALCYVLERYGTTREMMQMLTLVNRMVAYDYESAPKEPSLKGKKQIPSVTHQLTKQLYFPVKK